MKAHEWPTPKPNTLDLCSLALSQVQRLTRLVSEMQQRIDRLAECLREGK